MDPGVLRAMEACAAQEGYSMEQMHEVMAEMQAHPGDMPDDMRQALQCGVEPPPEPPPPGRAASTGWVEQLATAGRTAGVTPTPPPGESSVVKPRVTTQESPKRLEANALFKAGDLLGAAAMYRAALDDPNEQRLPLLSNLGFCHLKLRQASRAVAPLTEALALTDELFASPKLATKAAARLYEAYFIVGDPTGTRRALADLRFYSQRGGGDVGGLGLKGVPRAADAEKVFDLLVTIAHSREYGESGLKAVRRLLEGVAAEAYDDEGGCAVTLATEVASKSDGRGPGSMGVRLLQCVLEDGPPADVRKHDGCTALMTAANCGRADLCALLLAAGASARATDPRGFTALHTALVVLYDKWTEEREEVIVLLLEHGAAVNAANHVGMTPLMYCAQQLRKERRNELRVPERLIAAGASTTPCILPSHDSGCQGFQAIDFVTDGADAPMRALLRQAAKAEGEEAEACLREHEWIKAYLNFYDDVIIPASKVGTDACKAAGMTDRGTLDLPWDEITPQMHAATILSETRRAELLVGRFAGLSREAVYDVAGNPLLQTYYALLPFVPLIILKSWPSMAALTDTDRGQIRRAWGLNQEAVYLSANLSNEHAPLFVPKKLHREFVMNYQAPLQHTYACAIPNEQAMDALAQLSLPIVEIGAGAGYWGALLRLRGVDCVLYDRSPPTSDGNNPYFNRQYTEVLPGDHGKAALHPGHALLLVWPYSDSEAEAPWARDKDPWDVQALRSFQGSTVAHVGDMNEHAPTVTTSTAFKQLLTASFREVERIDLPSWAHSHDSLTIWKRASSG